MAVPPGLAPLGIGMEVGPKLDQMLKEKEKLLPAVGDFNNKTPLGPEEIKALKAALLAGASAGVDPKLWQSKNADGKTVPNDTVTVYKNVRQAILNKLNDPKTREKMGIRRDEITLALADGLAVQLIEGVRGPEAVAELNRDPTVRADAVAAMKDIVTHVALFEIDKQKKANKQKFEAVRMAMPQVNFDAAERIAAEKMAELYFDPELAAIDDKKEPGKKYKLARDKFMAEFARPDFYEKTKLSDPDMLLVLADMGASALVDGTVPEEARADVKEPLKRVTAHVVYEQMQIQKRANAATFDAVKSYLKDVDFDATERLVAEKLADISANPSDEVKRLDAAKDWAGKYKQIRKELLEEMQKPEVMARTNLRDPDALLVLADMGAHTLVHSEKTPVPEDVRKDAFEAKERFVQKMVTHKVYEGLKARAGDIRQVELLTGKIDLKKTAELTGEVLTRYALDEKFRLKPIEQQHAEIRDALTKLYHDNRVAGVTAMNNLLADNVAATFTEQLNPGLKLPAEVYQSQTNLRRELIAKSVLVGLDTNEKLLAARGRDKDGNVIPGAKIDITEDQYALMRDIISTELPDEVLNMQSGKRSDEALFAQALKETPMSQKFWEQANAAYIGKFIQKKLDQSSFTTNHTLLGFDYGNWFESATAQIGSGVGQAVLAAKIPEDPRLNPVLVREGNEAAANAKANEAQRFRDELKILASLKDDNERRAYITQSRTSYGFQKLQFDRNQGLGARYGSVSANMGGDVPTPVISLIDDPSQIPMLAAKYGVNLGEAYQPGGGTMTAGQLLAISAQQQRQREEQRGVQFDQRMARLDLKMKDDRYIGQFNVAFDKWVKKVQEEQELNGRIPPELMALQPELDPRHSMNPMRAADPGKFALVKAELDKIDNMTVTERQKYMADYNQKWDAYEAAVAGSKLVSAVNGSADPLPERPFKLPNHGAVRLDYMTARADAVYVRRLEEAREAWQKRADAEKLRNNGNLSPALLALEPKWSDVDPRHSKHPMRERDPEKHKLAVKELNRIDRLPPEERAKYLAEYNKKWDLYDASVKLAEAVPGSKPPQAPPMEPDHKYIRLAYMDERDKVVKVVQSPLMTNTMDQPLPTRAPGVDPGPELPGPR